MTKNILQVGALVSMIFAALFWAYTTFMQQQAGWEIRSEQLGIHIEDKAERVWFYSNKEKLTETEAMRKAQLERDLQRMTNEKQQLDGMILDKEGG